MASSFLDILSSLISRTPCLVPSHNGEGLGNESAEDEGEARTSCLVSSCNGEGLGNESAEDEGEAGGDEESDSKEGDGGIGWWLD